MSHSRERWNKACAGRADSALTRHEDAPETALEIIRARLAPGRRSSTWAGAPPAWPNPWWLKDTAR